MVASPAVFFFRQPTSAVAVDDMAVCGLWLANASGPRSSVTVHPGTPDDDDELEDEEEEEEDDEDDACALDEDADDDALLLELDACELDDDPGLELTLPPDELPP